MDGDNRTVQLTWNTFTDANPSKEAEEYVLEQSINGGEFHEVTIY